MSDTKWETGPWVALPGRVRFCRIKDETPLFEDGLWHILPSGHLDRLPICVVDHGDDHHAPTREKAERTARLIAAAPEIYGALEGLHNAIDSCVELTPALLLKCRAALAKASWDAA